MSTVSTDVRRRDGTVSTYRRGALNPRALYNAARLGVAIVREGARAYNAYYGKRGAEDVGGPSKRSRSAPVGVVGGGYYHGRRRVYRKRMKKYSYKKKTYKKKISRKLTILTALKYGSNYKYSLGGTAGGPVDAVVGAAAPVNLLLQSFGRACLKRLAARAGLCIRNWDGLPPDNATMFWVLIYRLSDDAAISVTNYAVPALSWDGIAVDIANKLLDLTAFATGGVSINLQSMEIRNENGSADYRSQLLLSDAVFQLEGSHTIVIQNRTQPVAADNSTDDVRSNPLLYKRFMGSGNTIIPKSNSNAVPVVANSVNGIMLGLPEQGNRLLIDRGHFSNVKRVNSGSINPGMIQRFTSNYKFKFNASVFLNRLQAFMVMSTGAVKQNRRCMVGNFQVFEFDRLCDTRSGEPDISIGYEVIHSIRSILTPGSVYQAASTFNGNL